MSNSINHSLPYPIYNAKYTLLIPYLDADGDPTDPTTPDTEISQDGGTFADCTEEVTTISGSNGTGYITLTGAEMKCVTAAICGKVASGPKATLAFLQPRVLPVISNGTAQSGGNTAITLASGAPAYDLTGCFVRTTGGTGGGGTNGANNQARMITAYNVSTKEATVFPAWETNPANDTTYDILLSDLSVNNPVNTDIDTLLTRLGSPAGASVSADIATIDGIVDTITAKIIGTLASGTHNPQSGDAFSRIGANGAGLTSLGDTRLNNLDAAITSRSTLTAAQVWDALVSGISVANSIGKRIIDFLTGDIFSRLGAPTSASIAADIQTRLAQSSYTTPDNAGIGNIYNIVNSAAHGNAALKTLLDSILDDTGTSGVVVAPASKSGYSLTTPPPTVAEILAAETEAGLTLKHALQIITALALKASGGGTSSISFRNYGDTKNRITMTVDANGNRTAIAVSLD